MIWFRYHFYRLISWGLHILPRRFTPAGLLLLGAAFFSGFLGMDMDQTVAFQGFGLCLAILLVAVGTAIWFRGRFVVRRELPRFGSVGQPFAYRILVQNRANTWFRDLELLEDLADPRPTRKQFAAAERERWRARSFRWRRSNLPLLRARRAVHRAAPLTDLPPRGEAEARVEMVPLQRGPLRFASVTIARADPLGIFRGFVKAPLPQTLLVLPKRYALPPLELPGARQYQRDGLLLTAAIGESEEFVSLRDYRPGDPLSRVHWRSWARLRRPIVKEFQDEFMVRHALILDTFAGPEAAGAFEEAVSIAASLTATINTQESLLDLMFVGPQTVCFTTGRGLGQMEQALEILASVQPCQEKPFSDLWPLVRQHVGMLCGCVCVLLDWDESRQELVRELQARGLPLLLLVVADKERAARIRTELGDTRPQGFHLLEPGRIEEGLRGLKTFASSASANATGGNRATFPSRTAGQ